MRVRYDPEADVLMIVLRDAPPVDAFEEPKGIIIISYGEDGDPVSVEFLNASVRGLMKPDELQVIVQTVR
jgi:uncharacterized protein YuzE